MSKSELLINIWNKLIEIDKDVKSIKKQEYKIKKISSGLKKDKGKTVKKNKKQRSPKSLFKDKFPNITLPPKPTSSYFIYQNENKAKIQKAMLKKVEKIKEKYPETVIKKQKDGKVVSWSKREIKKIPQMDKHGNKIGEKKEWTGKFEKKIDKKNPDKKPKDVFWKIANEIGHVWKKESKEEQANYKHKFVHEELPKIRKKWEEFKKTHIDAYNYYISVGGVDPIKAIKSKQEKQILSEKNEKKKKMEKTNNSTNQSNSTINEDDLHTDSEDDSD